MNFACCLRVLLSGVLLALLAGCATTAPGSASQPKQLRERQIIITLLDDATDRWQATREAIAREYRLLLVGDFPLTSIRVQCLVYEVATDQSISDLITRLRTDPRVESVQENQVFAGLRGHADMYASLMYGAKSIHADRAHRFATGRGVRIAMIDTGVDASHPDLRGRVTKTQNFVEGGELSFARDAHGTAVAGVIAARADDFAGIFGVAPEADLLALKACWYPKVAAAKALCSSWTIAKAIDFAITAQAQVLNMSLSGPPDALLSRLIARAHTSSVTVVAAVGDDTQSLGFPASLDEVIAVTASDANGKLVHPPITKRGFVAAAPGVDILTTTPNDGYDFVSGSSLAAAHVSGLVALLKQHSTHLSSEQVAALIAETSTGSGSNANAVRVVNACAALRKLLAKPSC